MLWLNHDSFEVEFNRFASRHPNIISGLEKVKKLLAVQFDPINPQVVIPPGKLHRVREDQVWTLWKVETMSQGLRPNQWPRIWFVVSGDTITFLTIGTHIDNYDNNEKDRIALARISELS